MQDLDTLEIGEWFLAPLVFIELVAHVLKFAERGISTAIRLFAWISLSKISDSCFFQPFFFRIFPVLNDLNV